MSQVILNSFPISVEKALSLSDHHYVWRATLRDGTVILEQPGLSSDHLPRDEVVRMEYLPRENGIPSVLCDIDLDKGERFVRYWTTLWHQGQGQRRIYVLGVELDGKHAMVGIYPHHGSSLVFATTRPFSPPWVPHPFKLLPEDAILRGGPGTPAFGWTYDGFGGLIINQGKVLVFSSVYP